MKRKSLETESNTIALRGLLSTLQKRMSGNQFEQFQEFLVNKSNISNQLFISTGVLKRIFMMNSVNNTSVSVKVKV